MDLKVVLILAAIVAAVSLIIVSFFVAKAPEIPEAEESNLFSADLNSQ
jgi:hypothetical protein